METLTILVTVILTWYCGYFWVRDLSRRQYRKKRGYMPAPFPWETACVGVVCVLVTSLITATFALLLPKISLTICAIIAAHIWVPRIRKFSHQRVVSMQGAAARFQRKFLGIDA